MPQGGYILLPHDSRPSAAAKKRLLQALSVLAMLAVAIGFGGWLWLKHGWDLDKTAQQKIVADYMADVEQETNGTLKNDADSYNAFDGYVDGHITFRVVLGSCSDVSASLESPKARPSSKRQLHTLRIEMPGTSGNADAPKAYQVIHPEAINWARPLLDANSGLSHCFTKK